MEQPETRGVSSKYILTLDVGTTGVKSIIFDESTNVISKAFRPTPILIPARGRVEQGIVSILDRVCNGIFHRYISFSHYVQFSCNIF
jgi:glycerol kinase